MFLIACCVAATAAPSYAGCGPFSRFIERVEARRGVCKPAAVAIVPASYASVPVVSVNSQSCPNGQCANQALQVEPVRRFSLFGR
jgi:hypothetical protein